MTTMRRAAVLAAMISALVAATGAVPATAEPTDPAAGQVGDDSADGSLPDGRRLSPYDLSAAVVNRLEPDLLGAVQQATDAAAADGVTLELTSGWRSPAFQRQLFADAVAQYGSAAVAAQYVASPEESKHVIGRAVDVGPATADHWLRRNGERFGLCQIYANEIWHYELAADYGGTCPQLRANAAG